MMMRCKTITHLSCCSVCAWSNCNRSECRRWDTPCNQCFHGSLSTNSGGSEQSAAWCGKHDGDDCCCYWAVWSLGRGSMMASSVENMAALLAIFWLGCQWGWAVRLRSVSDCKIFIVVLRERNLDQSSTSCQRWELFCRDSTKKWVSHKFCII